MSINFFYDPNGSALCQNDKGLTFYLQGQPPARPQASRPDAAQRPSYPGQHIGPTKSEAPIRGRQQGWPTEAPRG